MFPLRDTIPSSSVPVVTLALIAVNTLVFFYEVQLGPILERFLLLYGFVPARYLYVSEAESVNDYSLVLRTRPCSVGVPPFPLREEGTKSRSSSAATALSCDPWRP